MRGLEIGASHPSEVRRGRFGPGDLAWRAGLLALALAAASVAAQQLDASARLSVINAGLTVLGLMDQAPTPMAVEAFARENGLGRLGATCDPAVLYAEAAFWRYVVASRDETVPPDVRNREILWREAITLQQISCNPTDGLAWADTADTALRRGAGLADVRQRLSLSRRYAPYEGEALRARLDTYSFLDDGSEVLEFWRDDLRTALLFGSPDLAASAMLALPEDLKPLASKKIQALPAARREAIERAMAAQTAGED